MRNDNVFKMFAAYGCQWYWPVVVGGISVAYQYGNYLYRSSNRQEVDQTTMIDEIYEIKKTLEISAAFLSVLEKMLSTPDEVDWLRLHIRWEMPSTVTSMGVM